MAEIFDYVIIGSGFGGSVAAMRLAEKGYRVLVLERGKRFEDKDFPKSNWNLWKFMWLPVLRCFGIFEMTFLNGLLALRGSGVGGGSLTYGNLLMEPEERLFEAPTWRLLADWKKLLRPHYVTARRMLGVTRNPRLWPSDEKLREVVEEMGYGETFQPTEVGVFFSKPGEEEKVVPDPYFGGQGPARTGCNYCGGCMVGCRYNAKNTLLKNYLYFAEKWSAQIIPEVKAVDIRPLSGAQPDGGCYEVLYRRSTAILPGATQCARGRNVIVAAGTLGTLELLFRCRDITRSLPNISRRLGERVRTNNDNILGVTSRDRHVDCSKGIAISSICQVGESSRVEAVRYSDKSSFIRVFGMPMIEAADSNAVRILKTVGEIIRHPIDFLYFKFIAPWARRTTIFLVMQTDQSLKRIRLGRSIFTLFRKGLVIEREFKQHAPSLSRIGMQVTHAFARKTNGIVQAAFSDSMFNTPTTAHLMGGATFGQDESEGVIDLSCQVFNYPGLYVMDGSIMPGNAGINPSLTITALAEYALSQVPPKPEYN